MDTKSFIRSTFDKVENLIIDNFNQAYEGYSFTSHKLKYHYRNAKLTPHKKGYFVTFWKKNNYQNMAYDKSDDFDFLVINIKDNNLSGYFLFPKDILVLKNIITIDEKKGKMGFRVYPFYEDSLNDSAKKTYAWQSLYFNKTT